MFDNAVSRLNQGHTNNRDTHILSDLYVPDRATHLHEFSPDFDQFVGADWVVTGAGTAGLVAGDGGWLSVVSAVSAFQEVQKTPANFSFTKGFRSWGAYQIALDSLLGTVLIGLMNVTTTPFTPASQTDGCYFLTLANTGQITFNVAVGGVITTVNTGSVLIPGAVPNANLYWYYDGGVYPGAPLGRIAWQVDGPGVTVATRGEVLVPATGTIAAFPGATLVAPVVAVNATTAAARTLIVDRLYTAKDEVNINATQPF